MDVPSVIVAGCTVIGLFGGGFVAYGRLYTRQEDGDRITESNISRLERLVEDRDKKFDTVLASLESSTVTMNIAITKLDTAQQLQAQAQHFLQSTITNEITSIHTELDDYRSDRSRIERDVNDLKLKIAGLKPGMS